MTLAGVEIGSIPGWITSAGIVGLLAVYLNFILKNKAGDRLSWGKLIEASERRIGTLEERCERLEHRDAECRRDLAVANGRIAELEGYMLGQGKARQDAANIVAVERMADKKNGEGGK